MFKIFQVPTVKPRERFRETLPKPPDGMDWLQNAETREWKLVPAEEVKAMEDPSEVSIDFGMNNSSSSAFANPFNVVEETTNVSGNGSPSGSHQSNSSNSNGNGNNPPHQRVVVTGHMMMNDHHNHTNHTNHNSNSGESKSNEEADWELLSDRASGSTHSHTGSHGHHGIAFVSRNGSVSTKGSSCLLHKRTPSSSTIDSNDLMNLGPSGKGVLGVDYVEHILLPTDTLQGICLAYKVSASRLKRANHFSGESLQLAPKKLVIPISKQALRQGYLRVQDTDSKEYKMHAIQAEFPMLGLTEAKAYLELADWVLKDAVQSARDDSSWETKLPEGQLQPGEIRVMMNVQSHPEAGHMLNFSAQGAGYSSRMPNSLAEEEEKTNNEPTSMKPVDPKRVQTTAVQPEDIHNVSPTHNSFGVEMQSLSPTRK